VVHFLFVCFLFWGVGVSWVYLFVIFGLILWLVYFMILFFFCGLFELGFGNWGLLWESLGCACFVRESV
jgi:hypothetical protein